MKINCLSCGHMVDLRDVYDDYEGQIKCWVCGTLLMIKTEEGNIRSMNIAGSINSSTVQAAKRNPVNQNPFFNVKG